jgi:Protein of unknown function (DUF732)
MNTTTYTRWSLACLALGAALVPAAFAHASPSSPTPSPSPSPSYQSGYATMMRDMRETSAKMHEPLSAPLRLGRNDNGASLCDIELQGTISAATLNGGPRPDDSRAFLDGCAEAARDILATHGCGNADPLDCVDNLANPNAGEQRFVRDTRPFVPDLVAQGGDMAVWQTGRGVCILLKNGHPTGYVVTDLAAHLGTSKQIADQVVDAAMEDICPGWTVGSDGVVR